MPEGGKQTGEFSASRKRMGVDALVLGVTFAAIALFVQLGARVLPGAIAGIQNEHDGILTSALLLNIALIIFGWRRYGDLRSEIDQRRLAESEARDLAEIDPLTGCYNRRSVYTQLEHLAANAAERGDAVAYIMLDLDRFKQVNDSNGHAAGDAMLRESAARIRVLAPAEAIVARLGGDEFMVALPFASDQASAVERLVEGLIKAIARPVPFEGSEVETTISAGISRSDGTAGGNPQAQVHKADIAMYHAKRSGRNTFSWFEPSMESEIKFRSAVENGIRRGIPIGEFVPHYEKQIDLESGALTGFEMLARWTSPSLGKVSPEVFIPVAEEIGLIGELSESLIRRALADARNWDPKLTLSVNISPIQLRDPWFAQRLLKLLVEANFPPSRFEIEVTESCLHENVTQVRALITSLKNQGVTVSLDDFGTGYSSLSQLRSLPFDRIKIDRSFVIGLLDDPGNGTIIQSIIALGEGLGLPITAEGIENEEVLAELRRYGNFKGQGYLYGFPESAERTEEQLAQLDLLLETQVPTEPAQEQLRAAQG